jgi:hypothetical protein
MVDATIGTAGATAPKTPPHGVNSESDLKSTPLAIGSAAVSEYISTVGVKYVEFLFAAATTIHAY